jgi:hypothetical protein
MIERSAETTQSTGAGDPRDLPEVRAALRRVAQGSYADGVIRILLLLADRAAGSGRTASPVRRRCSRSANLLPRWGPSSAKRSCASSR